MTEIPDHLLRRASEARKKAAAQVAGPDTSVFAPELIPCPNGPNHWRIDVDSCYLCHGDLEVWVVPRKARMKLL